MSVCDVMNTSAQKVAEIEVSDSLFAVPVNTGILHEVVCMQRACKRSGNAATKTRGMVSGGGIKPWKQKGTGRARAGSSRSSVWCGGGTAFGPQPRDYSYSMPKKVRRLALRMAISARMAEGNLVILDQFQMDAPKTKDFVAVMKNFAFDNCLLVAEKENANLLLSARNAVGYQIMPVAGLNVYDILKHDKLMIVRSTLEQLEARLMV
ncbi:MAG: 50S ribosomal protein L4 [Candidatus Electronema sp. VV]|uniref:50S ribosomal protein L4 n=1 Tax=unclassified Candidatus Electronema TaxID=2677064 RepID=UPI003AA831B0